MTTKVRRHIVAREDALISRIGQEAALRYLERKERMDPIKTIIDFSFGLTWMFLGMFIVALIAGTLL
jgi:hypothetical protein